MRALNTFRLYLILFSIFMLIKPVYSQNQDTEFEKKFTYTDNENTELFGTLILNYSFDISEQYTEIVLDISVEWSRAGNVQITDTTQLPYIVIFKRKVGFEPENSFECLTDAVKGKYCFKNKLSLEFQSEQNQKGKEIEISYEFNISNSIEEVNNGIIDRIRFYGGERGDFITPVKIPDEIISVNDPEVIDNNDSISNDEKPDPEFQRKSDAAKSRLTVKRNSLFEQLESINNHKSSNQFVDEISKLNNSLESININSKKALEQIKNSYNDLRTEINLGLGMISDLDRDIHVYDSIYNKERGENILLPDEGFSISQIKLDKATLFGEYISIRTEITSGLDNSKLKIIDSNNPITEESIGADSLNKTEDSTIISTPDGNKEEITDPLIKTESNLWFLIPGTLLFIIILIVLIRRNRNKRSGKLKSNLNNVGRANTEEAKLYYPISWDEQNTAYVNGVSLNQNVIKEIFNFSRNSLSRKLAYEVGGYIFGHFEKAGDNGTGTYSIFIDNFVPARTIESPSYYQLDFGAEAVEELEAIIQNNQNLALLGWFHTHPGHTPILSEQNNIIQKKFFYEKWQIAIVIDPTDELCPTAIYGNNPKGKITQLGAEKEFFNFNDLVDWTENPDKEKVVNRIHAYNNKEYYITNLNDKWCDSVVAEVRMEKTCISEIQKIIRKKNSGILKNRIAGFLYGNVTELKPKDNKNDSIEYNVVIEEFIESTPANIPSKTSGFNIMAWFGFDNCEMLELIEPALELHEKEFHEDWQFVMLLSKKNSEIRMFSKKQSLEMNNNIIETNELNLRDMTEWLKSISAKK